MVLVERPLLLEAEQARRRRVVAADRSVLPGSGAQRLPQFVVVRAQQQIVVGRSRLGLGRFLEEPGERSLGEPEERSLEEPEERLAETAAPGILRQRGFGERGRRRSTFVELLGRQQPDCQHHIVLRKMGLVQRRVRERGQRYN